MVKRDRTKHWIDSQIQGALAVRIILHWLVFAVVAAILTFTMQFLGEPLVPFTTHLKNVWNNQGIFGIVIVILMPLFIYDTVRLSHRFAGPIVRVRRAMQEIANGRPARRLQFRDNDFWSGLADDFNSLIDEGYLVADSTSGTSASVAQSDCGSEQVDDPQVAST